VIPETGNLAFLGIPVRNAFEMAEVDRRTTMGKSPVDVVVADSQGTASMAVTAHKQSTVARGIDGVFSLLSGPTLALKPIVQAEGRLFIAATIDASVCEGSTNLIRPYYNNAAEGRAVLEFLRTHGAKSVGIIYSTDSATAYEVEKVVLPGLATMGATVTKRTYSVGEKDFRNQVLAVHSAKPGFVLAYGFGSDLPQLASQLREQGVFGSATVIGPVGVADAILGRGLKPFAGMQYIAPSFMFEEYEAQNPAYGSFKQRYLQKYGADAFSESAVYAYDTYNMLAEAVEATASTKAQDIKAQLVAKGFTGLAGRYIFEPDGNTDLPISLAEIAPDGSRVAVVKVFN
jgi:ABC-type branched-subunit amino acid transport system substrate-binding protein